MGTEGERVSYDLVARYADLSVPRYTSYPTAAEFSSAVGSAEHARWLQSIGAGEPVSLYLHVPYCWQICFYCGCHAKLARRDDVIEEYRTALEAEIDLIAGQVRHRLPVARIAWGGGTPSILGVAGFASVLDRLGRHFAFVEGMEHAVELDPRHVGSGLAEGLAALGINRASLGVQDLDPEVQTAIGRLQPLPVVRAAVSALRDAGIGSINFDLLYGLPRQTPDSVRATCMEVASLEPDRIAVYGYAHLPQRRANQKRIDVTSLPGPSARFRQARIVAETFDDFGYQPVGMDHFAKPCDPLARAAREGRLHRNFQGYTDDDQPILIGFGASAISRFAEGFVQNVADVPSYVRTVTGGARATARGCTVGAEDRARAAIIEQLMCNFRADLQELDPAHSYAGELAMLRQFADAGLLTVDGGSIAMTDVGRPFVRVAASVFDRFRTGQKALFSRAV